MSISNLTLPDDIAQKRRQQAAVATGAQMQAMRPQGSAQVAASAGTGKTYVLTRRFLRLLLEDRTLSPSEILAVTYTKAGATEMHNRLTEMLARWAVMDAKTLCKELSELLEKYPPEETLGHARGLFSAVLDDPVGIRVMTVHSFCQSLLAQFPLEAGVNAGFRILEGREAEALLQEKMAETYTELADHGPEDSPYWWAFSHLVTTLADASLQSEFKAYIENRRRFERLFENSGGLEGVLQTLAAGLEIERPTSPPGKAMAALHQEHLKEVEQYRAFLKELADALSADGGKLATEFAGNLYAYLGAREGQERENLYPILRDAFITGSGTQRSHITPKTLQDEHPALCEKVTGFFDFLKQKEEQQFKLMTYFKTASYLVLADAISQRYAAAKQTQGVLDFEDLIRLSKKLLTGGEGQAAWVRFKMDGRISHIMLDEAQDTDSDQWDIIRALIDDFFTGAGQHETTLPRTFFAVGDGKQAIYRFRGAERHVFEGMLTQVNQMAAPAGHKVKEVDLNTSFRSSDVILDFVDQVFSLPETRRAIDGQETPLKHAAYHLGAGGKIEIWPRTEKAKRGGNASEFTWQMPLPGSGEAAEASQREALFCQLARRIRALIDERPFLGTTGTFLLPSDIMVLCRSGEHASAFLAALAAEGVTASKTGDFALEKDPVIADVMALMRFLANPTDDLSLIHSLRSPLFGVSDTELETLRQRHRSTDKNTGGQTYFKTLCRLKEPHFMEKAALLKTLLAQVDLATPHQMLGHIFTLTEARGKLFKRYMGHTQGAAAEAISQALDRFADAALDYSGKEGTSLIGFIHWFDKGGLSVKLEAGANSDAVQVMTAHASKGLQAAVVVMPETGGDFYTQTSKEYKLWRVEPETKRDDMFLFGLRKGMQTQLQQDLMDAEKERVREDEMRLLYVALTRAQEHLIIAATEGRGDNSWYNIIRERAEAAAEENADWQEDDNGTLVYEQKNLFRDAPTHPPTYTTANTADNALPAWVLQTPEKEQRQSRELASQSEAEGGKAGALFDSDTQKRYRRGLLLHRLLEVLPGLPEEKRREKGATFLTYSGADLPEKTRADMLGAAIGVIDAHPELYAEGYRPEAALACRTPEGKSLKGRIDCLRVTQNSVYIIDYKTDARPPAAVPALYRKQLEAYARMAGGIWPGKEVRCGILWTAPAPPRLDWVEIQEPKKRNTD